MNDRNLTFGVGVEVTSVAEAIRAKLPELTKSEASIARYILNTGQRVGFETGASLAANTQVSEITVSRFLRKLGYRGMREMKQQFNAALQGELVPSTERFLRLLSGSESAMIEAEARAVLKLSTQLARSEWRDMVTQLEVADRVFVTGFQTVRGMAEDFSRRLAIVRDAVRFVAAHDGGLAEWISPDDLIQDKKNLLVLVDAQPYAREAEKICSIARGLGFGIAVFTDEFNNWAYSYTDLVFHTETNAGTFLETTAPMNSILNYVVHAVAEINPERSRARIDNFINTMKELDVL